MDTLKCQVLLKVLDTGSISEAASQLGYSPSGVSRMMAALEDEVGFQLLLRSRNGITATDACQQLLPVLRNLTYYGHQYDTLVAKIKGLEIGDIHLGTSYRSYYPWLTAIIKDFRSLHPGLTIHIQSDSSSQLLEAMAQRRLDLCLISQREGSHEWYPLKEDAMVAWLPPQHPHRNYPTAPMSLFASDPYIETHPGQDTDNARLLKKSGITPQTILTTSDSQGTYSLVEAGLGIALNNRMNSEGLTGKVVIRTLDPPCHVTLGLAIPAMSSLSHGAKAFAQFMIKAMA